VGYPAPADACPLGPFAVGAITPFPPMDDSECLLDLEFLGEPMKGPGD